MGYETSKANRRRVKDPIWFRIFSGAGIDIGCGDDPLDRENCFPGISRLERFDRQQGDGSLISNFHGPCSFDFVYSSHCLEHLPEPWAVLPRWWALVKPGGFMVIVVPDEDLYEQGVFPSRWAHEHQWTFTLWKPSAWSGGGSWSPKSIGVIDLVRETLDRWKPVILRLAETGYDYGTSGVDQTAPSPGAEANIEVVLQKL